MLVGVYIFVDDDFGDPVYADPALDRLDEDLRIAMCEAVDEVLEGERSASGSVSLAGQRAHWKCLVRRGLSFVAVVDADVGKADTVSYLSRISTAYLDEVDDPRNPDRHGVADVIMDIEPPGEE